MRVFLSVDMEGAAGVCHRDHLVPGGQDYERARKWLTGEVNAAVEGAVAAGAREVVVADGHGTMRNLIVEEMHEAARLVLGPAQARNRPLGQLAGVDVGNYEGALLVGYHSRAGTPNGLLSHTWVGMLVHQITLNGKPAGEALLNAAVLGHYRIPVLFASGADDFCREAKADLGDDLETVETKKALGPTACLSLSPARSQKLIREGAERAVRHRLHRKPLATALPVVLDLEFHRGDARDRALELGGDASGARGIRYTGATVPEAVMRLWRGLEESMREDGAFLK